MLHDTDFMVIRGILGNALSDPELERYLSPRGREIAAALRAADPFRRTLLLTQLLSKQELQQLGVPIARQRPLFLRAIDLHRLPPLRWLVEGELPAESLAVLYGESGAGKSFIALDYALRLAHEGKTVVYAANEGLSGYAKRVEAWCTHHRRAQPSRLLFYTYPVNLISSDDVDRFAGHMERLEEMGLSAPVLVVVDTLAMSMIGADENSARDMGLALASCRQLIDRLGATVLLVHHSGKVGLFERGSSALRGNADVMLRVAAADDVVVLECTKMKDAEAPRPRYLALRSVGSSLVALPVDEATGVSKQLTTLQRRVLETLGLETCAGGVTLRELAELVGAPYSTMHRAVSNMIRAELVERGKTGYQLTGKGRVIQGDPLGSGSHGSSASGQERASTAKEGAYAAPVGAVLTDPRDPGVFQPKLLVESVDQADQRESQGRVEISQYHRAGL
jgi:archaellum biogenesis ATPase FlaH